MGVHLSHDFRPRTQAGQVVHEIVGWHNEDEGENNCLDESFLMVREGHVEPGRLLEESKPDELIAVV